MGSTGDIFLNAFTSPSSLTASRSAPTSAPVRSQALSSAQEEYLTFRLGQEYYGVNILQVQEIRSYEPPTRMAHAAQAIKGVLDLRGVMVPIVDLRIRLGCSEVSYTPLTVVIILNVGQAVIGAIVDAVADVVRIPAASVLPAPALPSHGEPHCMQGLATVDNRMLIMLDMDKLLGSADMGLLPDAADLAPS